MELSGFLNRLGLTLFQSALEGDSARDRVGDVCHVLLVEVEDLVVP